MRPCKQQKSWGGIVRYTSSEGRLEIIMHIKTLPNVNDSIGPPAESIAPHAHNKLLVVSNHVVGITLRGDRGGTEQSRDEDYQPPELRFPHSSKHLPTRKNKSNRIEYHTRLAGVHEYVMDKKLLSFLILLLIDKNDFCTLFLFKL